MDFITQLPLSNKFDSNLVVVERFSKMAIFIPAYGSITALDLAEIFISHVFPEHGLPQVKISRDLSTSFHPETDGHTERVNQILEQYLWIYVSYHQDDWHTWLPLAEFAYNNAEHSSKKSHHFSPFMEEIPDLTQFTFLKMHLLENYQKNSNQYRKLSKKNSSQQ
ncbi:hypothetical protein O181_091236 [Austropuccinia psidii MF-1]|uniref:Integrase catalytic domain-containing protein n=1 Tax=Austropuccinia psidii MF-1 TaxID=1389203 RepID=A0A9Q3IX44_9BASI|nr:hypothetical protein [Austropuccinia psidii MF-1]